MLTIIVKRKEMSTVTWQSVWCTSRGRPTNGYDNVNEKRKKKWAMSDGARKACTGE